MTPFQLRVIEEKRLLDEKITALENFIFRNATWFDVSKDERLRMTKQYCHMSDYSRILSERIAGFADRQKE